MAAIPGFNMPVGAGPAAPMQMIPPEILAKLAASAFRPPQPMQSPGLNVPQQQGGFSVGDGLQAASGLMSMLPRGAGTKSGVPTANGDPTGGAGPAYLGGSTPLGAQPDFLTGLMRRLFGA